MLSGEQLGGYSAPCKINSDIVLKAREKGVGGEREEP